MSGTKASRKLSNNAFQAAENANNPSASNPFITEVESAVGSASLLLYPTSAASAIPTYSKLVNTISDPDYDDPAVDSSTGVINATGQLIAEFASEEGVIDGNPGVVNVNTIGNIRRVSGTGTATFYFEVYIRDNGGTETLIGTSNTTGASSNAVYEQYFASCLINATNFGPTDRVVTKWYANRLPGGSDPTYEIQLGGATPVKITFPVPFVNLPSTVEELNDLTDVTTGLPGSPTNADDGRVLYYDVDSGQWISDDIANISNVVKDCKTSVLTGSIPKGTPVYLAGYDNDLLVVEACDAANAAEMPCIGITAEALDDTNAKKVVSFGKIQGVDTSLWADGTELYVAVGGGFTTTRPTGTAEIQRVAVVLKGLDAAGGSIKVFNTSRTAGIPNLQQGNIWLGDADGYPVEEPLCPFLASDLQPTDIIAICRWNGSSYDRFAVGADDFTLNLYNADGTLTAARTLIGANFPMTWTQLRQFIIQLAPQNADDAFKIDVDTSLLSGGDNLFELYDIPDNVKRIQMNAAGFLIINEEYAIPATDGTAGQVLTTDGAGNVTFQTPGGGGGGSVWTPPKVGLQDYYNLGRTAPAAAPGASGVRYVFFGASTTGPGSVTDPTIEFTKYMGQDDGNDYDGSALSLRIHYQLFNTAPGVGTDNVRWSCQITFIEEGTDNINLAQLQSPFIDMNVSGKTPNIGYTEVLTPLLNTGSATGVRGIKVSLTRLNSDAGDTYTNDVDLLGIEILN